MYTQDGTFHVQLQDDDKQARGDGQKLRSRDLLRELHKKNGSGVTRSEPSERHLDEDSNLQPGESRAMSTEELIGGQHALISHLDEPGAVRRESMEQKCKVLHDRFEAEKWTKIARLMGISELEAHRLAGDWKHVPPPPSPVQQ